MVELNHIDKEILKILQENCRIPFSEIAKRLGVSEATVHLRVRKLRRNGVIRKFQAIIDPEKVGKTLTAIIAIRAEPRKYDSILERLKTMNSICEIYDVTGDYYAILKVRVGSREELAKVLDEIGKLDGVLNTTTMVVLRVIKEDYTIPIE
ncbi:MAG: AsnC family transcriptional regulator [Thermoprotei archaeon]|nr:MAG: AsnC family transcriptional regulator [Thermoprotei archaeon]